MGLCLLGAGTLLLTVHGDVALAVAGFTVGGAGMMFALTGLSTQVQLITPDDMRGRVMALWSVAFLGSRPLTALMDGTIADRSSTGAALVTVAGIVLLAAWCCRPTRVEAA
jgi:hypothetical protein